MAKKVDEQTFKLIEIVKQQREEIATLEKPLKAKTNLTFSWTDDPSDGRSINLRTVSEEKLWRVLAFLTAMLGAYVIMQDVGKQDPTTEMKAPEATWQGYPIAAWADDIEALIKRQSITAKRKRLEALEERLSAIITPELKRQMELEAISKELGV